MRWLVCALLLASTSSYAGSIYLCKAYSGGSFWSSVYCGQKQAVLDRIVSVPDDIPWDQKVALGEQARAEAASMGSSPMSTQQVTRTQSTPAADTQSECSALSATIASIDAQARQPLTGHMQDVLKEQRQRARDRQFRLGCR